MGIVKQGYKQTDIGIIPMDWEVKAVLNIAPLQRGFDLPINNISNGLYPVVFSNGILKSHKVYRVKGPGVVTGRSGTIGKLFYVAKDFWPHNTTLWVTNFKGNSPKFVYYLFNRLNFNTLATGSGVPTLNRNDIHDLRIAIPNSKDEQTAIGTALSDIDALIAALDKKIAKKQHIKKGAMQQLLTGKKHLPGFSGKWVEKTYNDIFQKIPSKKFQISSVQYLEYGKYKIIDQGKKDFIGYTNDETKLFQCEKDGVIIFGDHTRIIKYSNFDFVVGADGVQLLLCKQGFSCKFIYYLLAIFEIPNTGYNRHFKFLKEFNCFLPQNKTEQTAIAQILTDMDNEIAQLEKERDKYKELKVGMMQVLLTGKVRLV
jgi:type I restriction enzyme, S subunit